MIPTGNVTTHLDITNAKINLLTTSILIEVVTYDYTETRILLGLETKTIAAFNVS